MRSRSQHQLSTLSAAFLTIILSQPIVSSPFSAQTTASPLADGLTSANLTLAERDCPIVCGYYNQLCCAYGQTCYTDSNNQAQCGAGTATAAVTTGPGYWQYYTSIWTETALVTRTSIYSSWVATQAASATWYPSAQTIAPLSCNYNQGESSCGNICCSSSQYCVVSGQCGTRASSGGYSAPLRPTSTTLIIATATLPTTTTVPFIAPMATGQMSNITSTTESSGLSGGAIAGIVIGVLAALLLLLLLCIFLCCKAVWDGLLALFGFNRNRRRKETVEYSSVHRTSAAGGGRTWYGGAARPARVERNKKKGPGLLPLLGAGAAGLLVTLGIRRHEQKKRYDEKSDYSYDEYASYDSYSSSDRRTRDTRRSAPRR